jgi:two-component system nitrogen regulation sensor histidine kinase NtrY
LQKSVTIGQFLYKNIYLLVIAAWLITISFVVDNYWSANASLKSVQKKIAGYIHEQESDIVSLATDSSVFRKIDSGNYEEDFLQHLSRKKYFVFFYRSSESQPQSLICWNTQKVLPLPSMITDKPTEGFVELDNGYYVWHRYESGKIKMLALIPVKWNYFISNDYLQNEFVIDKSLSVNYDITLDPANALIVKSKDGTGLFYLYEKSSSSINRNNIVAVLLKVSAILLILLFIQLFSTFISLTRKWWIGFLVLIISLLTIRILWYFFPVPMNFRQFELFSPTIYASGYVFRSLGDLLINAFFFVWIILFLRHHLQDNKVKPLVQISTVVKWVLLVAAAATLLFATFTAANIIRSLVIDSHISFDVINFFTLNEYSVIGFVVLCCISIGYYFLCQILVHFLKPMFSGNMIPLFLLVAVSGLVMLSFKVGKISGGFEIYVLAWLLLFLLLLNSNVSNLLTSRIISSKLVFWLFFFSVSISAVLVVENNRKEISNRRHYAEILATKANPASETLINSMLTDFRPDFLADNFNRLFSSASGNYLVDSLLNSNTSGYTNKYDTRVYAYTADEKPLMSEDSTQYNEINTVLNTQSKPTGIPGLYYFDQSFDMFSYISKKTLKDTSGKVMGYVFIMASPKKLRRDALYPELFSKGEENSIENSSSYAFAIYNNWKLVSSHNDYPFPSVVNKKSFKSQQFSLEQKKNFTELWYYAGADKLVVIAKENSLSIESITLFSYLFCSFLLVSALFWFINIVIKARFNRNRILSYWQLSIRNQIHGTIIFITVVSFLVIGVATIWFFIIRYEDNNREKLSRTIRIMEKEVKNTISSKWRTYDTREEISREYDKNLEQAVDRISEIHGVDVNLYDLEGNLQVSSLPLPYIKGILSTKMNPVAYYHIGQLKEIQFFQKESIGNLEFMSNYVPVIDASGNNYAYLNIPYFTSQTKLKQEISNFLVTIINLNAFIFLIAGIVALFITNRITHSFSVISEQMKKINLGSHNEAIEWRRDDEIGELVMEYNKMVNKLDHSASVLAKTEREGAWKEMARQVAHEIKNPLTPMKLSMQFLQKSIESNAPNVKELSENVARTLIEQIDHLSQIANDFSQFANIGDSRKERFDMNDTLRNVLHLHAVNDKMEIIQQLLPNPVMIDADKTHINRLFTNLVLNAIQSVPDTRSARIEVSQSIDGNQVLTKISDNGNGINETIQSKIFTPNFTTKTSGTGLGLAMCKRIVEQAEGEIWFETIQDVGTSFFVKLPLAN